MRPELTAVDDRVLLLFWDKGGREPGVRVRWLDADGRIGGMSSVVGASRPGLFWPAMDRASDGTFWLVWQQSPDKEGDDIFLRHLDAISSPWVPRSARTDYEPDKGKSPRVSAPSIAVSSTKPLRRVRARAGQAAHHRAHACAADVAGPHDRAAGTTKTSRQIGEVTARTRTRSAATTRTSRARRTSACSCGTRSRRARRPRSSIRPRARCSGASGSPRAAATRPWRLRRRARRGRLLRVGRVRIARRLAGRGRHDEHLRQGHGRRAATWIAPGRARASGS